MIKLQIRKALTALICVNAILWTSIPVQAEELNVQTESMDEKDSVGKDKKKINDDTEGSASASLDQEEFRNNTQIELVSQESIVDQTDNSLEALDDSGTLLTQYIEKEAKSDGGEKTRARVRAARGNNLTGNDALVYDHVKSYISKLASGEAEEAVVTIPFSELTDNQTAFSANELGLTDEELISKEESTIRPSQKAVHALAQKMTFSLENINLALLNDCPYELYWYDKTTTGGVKSSASL